MLKANRIHHKDAIEGLKQLPDESVDMCVTSPPYWGLRVYGTEPQVWGGDAKCHHTWRKYLKPAANGLTNSSMRAPTLNGESATRHPQLSCFCKSCGAWRGELGLEPMPDLYVSHLVDVFRHVRRVLKAQCTLWLVIGDCYSTQAGKVGESPGGGVRGDRWRAIGPLTAPNRLPVSGLKPKDLVGIPWMLAFALRNDGWYLRSDIVWHKPNPMPESVTDRPTRAHEYLFLLSKNRRYLYHAAAIAEPMVSKGVPNAPDKIKSPYGQGFARRGAKSGNKKRVIGQGRGRPGSHLGGSVPWEDDDTGTRNARTVWTISVRPGRNGHFATFPPELVRRCLLAGSRPGEVVLDPFMGSGTTAVVAKELGRHFIGFELNPEYVKIAEARLRPFTELKQKGGETLYADKCARSRRELPRSHVRRAA